METKFASIVSQVKEIAIRHGWKEIVSWIDELLKGQDCPVLLISSCTNDGENEALKTVKTYLETARISISEPVNLGQLIGETKPSSQPSFQKLVFVFECGKLVDAETYQMLKDVLFVRPVGTYAIVLTKAEKIQSEQDLDAVERIARGAFISDSFELRTREKLSRNNVFLWGNAGSTGFLSERLGQDQTALLAWVKQAESESLWKFQAGVVIEAALATYNREVNAKNEKESKDVILARGALADVSGLKDRFLHGFDGDAERLENYLTVSLGTLENELQRKIQDYLNQPQVNRLAVAEKRVDEIIQSGVRQWSRDLEADLRKRQEGMFRETKELFEDVNWQQINQLLDISTGGEQYPGKLLEALALMDGVQGYNLNRQDSLITEQGGVSDEGFIDVAIRYVVGVGVAVLLSGLLTNPVGAVAGAIGGTLGIAGVSNYQREKRQHTIKTSLEKAGKQNIHSIVQDMDETIKRQFRTNVNTEKKTITKAFDGLYEQINTVLACQMQTPEEQEVNADRETLQSFWKTVSVE